MAEQSGGEKTLPASPQKRRKAREDGRVARSQDLSAAFALIAALFTIRFLGPGLMDKMVAIFVYYFGNADILLADSGSFPRITAQAMWFLVPLLAPFLLVMMIIGVTTNVLQVGFLFTGKPLVPKLSKLNPFAGFGSLFSPRAGAELVKSILKVTVVGYIVWVTGDGWINKLVGLMDLTPVAMVSCVGGMTFTLWWRIVLSMLILGVLDYGFQRWQYERGLMMTQQEAKEEMKEYEGDPRIKQRIRQIQRQIAMQRMMAEVPKADVIVTNPIRYAVALRYDPMSMAAPIVVAKGARLIAERIRNLATEHDVPIVQKPELARAMFKSVEIGHAVPEHLFRAVAEVLAYVYRIDRRKEKIRERQQPWQEAELPN